LNNFRLVLLGGGDAISSRIDDLGRGSPSPSIFGRCPPLCTNPANEKGLSQNITGGRHL
jgi:hypothetical protein